MTDTARTYTGQAIEDTAEERPAPSTTAEVRDALRTAANAVHDAYNTMSRHPGWAGHFSDVTELSGAFEAIVPIHSLVFAALRIAGHVAHEEWRRDFMTEALGEKAAGRA